MKKLLKKTLAFALAATLVLGAGPLAGLCGLELPSFGSITANAANDAVTDSDTGLIISGNAIVGYDSTIFEGGHFTVPQTVNDVLITAIGMNAFNGCSAITELTIPDSVKTIEGNAFSYCSNLKKVNFNASSCTLGYGAAYGAGVFGYNDKLTEIVFGSNVTVIPNYVCRNTNSIETVTFNGVVTHIGVQSFEGCSSLAAIDLRNVKEIGNKAFWGCFSLASIDGNKNTDKNEVHFDFTSTIQTIGMNAFNGCSAITELTIPDSVKTIEDNAFSYCSNLKKVNFNASSCTLRDGAAYGAGVFGYNDKLTEIVFGSNVTVIPNYVCRNTNSIETVTFNGVVTHIGVQSFEGCSSLAAIDLRNVKEIGNKAFWGCSSLASIDGNKNTDKNEVHFDFTSTIQTIGMNAFNGCSAITELTIPDSVKTIEDNAFSYCSNLKKVNFNASSCALGYGAAYGAGVFGYNDKLTDIVFGSNVTVIPNYVCRNTNSIETVTFNGVVTHIGVQSFEGCSSLSLVECKAMRKTEWNKVTVMEGNDALENAEIKFMSEILIENNSGKTKLEPAEEIVLSAKLINIENESPVEWFVNGVKKSEGKEFIFASEEGGKYEIKAAVTDDDGKRIHNTIIVYVNYELKAERDDIIASCSGTAFNQKVKLSVTETKGERENGSIAISDNEINEQIGCFNIKTILADDSSTETVQPNGIVTIKMAIPAQYIGRTNFKIVHRLENGQRENFATNPKGSEKQLSVSSDGKYWIFEVTSFSDFEFFAVEAAPTVSIKNNTGSKTISYGETLRLTANTSNMPADAKIFWYVDGVKKGEGTTFEVSPESGSVEVTVKVVDANGNDYADTDISDTEKVTVKSGFFQKLISFFKNLFRISRVVTQALMVK